MRFVVYGAGAIGGVVGARLHTAGCDVVLVARGEHLSAIKRHGLAVDTAQGRAAHQIPAVGSAREIDWTDETVILLCVKSHQTTAALDDLASAADPQTPIACLQNGVSNEREALRRFAETLGVLVLMPATHLEPGIVVENSATVPGILDVGRYPAGTDDITKTLTEAFSMAGFSSVQREHIMAWKYRKLIGNTVGDAGVVLPKDGDELRQRVHAEAEAVLAAAGIPAVSGAADLERRGDIVSLRSAGEGPNSLGQSLARGLPTEIDYRAGEIVLLGRLYGVPTPATERVQRAARRLPSPG